MPTYIMVRQYIILLILLTAHINDGKITDTPRNQMGYGGDL